MGVEEFEDMLADVVSIEKRTGIDEYEKPTYGAAVTYKAHLSGKLRLVRDPRGEERVSSLSVTLGAAPGVKPDEDRLTLPAGWVPQQPPIIAVLRASDETGAHHEVLFCA